MSTSMPSLRKRIFVVEDDRLEMEPGYLDRRLIISFSTRCLISYRKSFGQQTIEK